MLDQCEICLCMLKYYVNHRPDRQGDNEVLDEDCPLLPLDNRKFLGYFEDCIPAVEKARETYPNTANGCIHCSFHCHTT